MFSLASEMEIPFTIHAGECHSAENVRTSVLMGARRIGHGIAMAGVKEIEELFLLHSQFGVTKEEALHMTENAVLAAFAEEEVKRELLEKLADFRKKSGQPDGR